jgi:hypothetical protein
MDLRKDEESMKKAMPSRRRRPRSSGKVTGKQAAITAALDRINQIEPQTQKSSRVIALLQTWLKDLSGYDERTWPALKTALNQERARRKAQRLFDD